MRDVADPSETPYGIITVPNLVVVRLCAVGKGVGKVPTFWGHLKILTVRDPPLIHGHSNRRGCLMLMIGHVLYRVHVIARYWPKIANLTLPERG